MPEPFLGLRKVSVILKRIGGGRRPPYVRRHARFCCNATLCGIVVHHIPIHRIRTQRFRISRHALLERQTARINVFGWGRLRRFTDGVSGG